MAKIKVHEIAKEMEKQSKEIIAFLQDKGIEVKAAQSSLEEEAAEMVRKAFGKAKTVEREAEKPAAKPEPAVKAAAPEGAKQEAASEKPAERPAAKPEQGAGGRERPAGAAEQPKKKKKIIVVSNPRNSNIPGQRRLRGSREQGRETDPPEAADRDSLRDSSKAADRRFPTRLSVL